MNIRRCIAALLTVLLPVLSQSLAAAQPQETEPITETGQTYELSQPSEARIITQPEMINMLENDRFVLFVNPATGQFNVTNKTSGKVWWSTPPAADEDSVANGRNKMELKSNMLFRYADPATGEIDLTNTYTGSVAGGNVTVKKAGDKVQIAYKMNDYRLYVPINIELTEDGFTCSISTKEILEGGVYRLYKVSLLPYFGAAGEDDTGYLFVPDGSGAIIEFNNQKHSYAQYSQTVYGTDLNFDIVQKKAVTQSARLPVFGIKSGDDGSLGIITAGSGIAQIEANVGGSKSSYNNAFASFNLRYIDVYYLGQSLGGSSKPVNIFDKNPFCIDEVKVKYVLLQGEDSGYVGMAKAYREHLVKTCGLERLPSAAPELHIELIGAIRKTERILGIPFTVTKPLTGFEKTRKILEKLRADGVNNIAVKYTNWEKGAVKQRVNDKANVIGSLGGKSGLSRLNRYAESEGIPLYLDADFTVVGDFKPAYPKRKNTTLNLSKKDVKHYQYSFVNFFKEPLREPQYLLSPLSAVNVFDSFQRRFDKLGIDNISLGGTADVLYSDFRNDAFNRDDSASCMAEIARKAAQRYGVMLKGGNAYSLPYADRVIDASSSSSDFDVLDMSVPFYQIALYGHVKTSPSAVNLSGNPKRELLKAIEYFSSLHYCWIGSDMRTIRNTDYGHLYSADYRTWIEQAAQYWAELDGIYQKTGGSDVKSHDKLADGVYKVAWENGLEVAINYNSQPVTVNGRPVEGEGYLIMESVLS